MNPDSWDEVSSGGLVGAVRAFADDQPAAPAMTFVDYSVNFAGTPVTTSFAELDLRARRIANALRELCGAGARVAVVCPHDLRYVSAFLGCLYAERTAVPLPMPDPFRGSRVTSILADCEADLVLTVRDPAVSPETFADPRGWPQRRVVFVEDLETLADDSMPRWRHDPSALAYLQYTSGSTRAPSGVRITHGNLAANIRQIAIATEYLQRGSTIASWVPFFHDMGLVLGLALPLALGMHAVHLSPTAFIQSPYRWLKLVSDYRAVWTGGPNFAYDLCVNRISEAQKATLDLSAVKGLYNGSEPIRAESLSNFGKAFAGCGLAVDLDGPSYGLAEATLAVTGLGADPKPELTYLFDRAELSRGFVREVPPGSPAGRTMVACGMPLENVQVRIVDPASGRTRADDEVGEIWLQGPNIADGYWNQPDRSAEIFGAVCLDHRTGRPVDGRWLRTGDLGFCWNGMLFIAGRLKDVIIVDGRNHDPADIEATVTEMPAPFPVKGVAVFSVDRDGAERVVAVLEIRQDPAVEDEIRRTVRATVSSQHGVEVHDVVLLPAGAIPRTSSRKVQRGETRALYLAGELTP